MSTRVYEAIKVRWDAQQLGDTITGGITAGRVPEGTSTPYCVFTPVGNAPKGWSNRSQFRRQLVQFGIFDTTLEKVGDHARAIMAAFDFAQLPLPTPDGEVLEMRNTGDSYLQEDDEMWQAIITYEVTRSKKVDYNPV